MIYQHYICLSTSQEDIHDVSARIFFCVACTLHIRPPFSLITMHSLSHTTQHTAIEQYVQNESMPNIFHVITPTPPMTTETPWPTNCNLYYVLEKNDHDRIFLTKI